MVDSHTKCTAKKPWYVSCNDLLGSFKIKISVYCISSAIICFNVFSLVIQMFSNQTQNIFKIMVTSINFVDLMYGFYMVILWTADQYFSDNFPVDEIKWRSSSMCFIAFSLAVNFSLLSPLTLSFLSNRCLVVLYPLNTKYKNAQFIGKCLGVIFIVSLIFAIVITAIVKHVHKVIPLTICTPFVDPTNSIYFIKVLTFVVVILQFGATLLILFAYSLLFKNLTTYPKPFQIARKSYSLTFSQIITVALSNIMCWIPSGLIYLLSIILSEYPMDIVIWTAIVITPVNSFINPSVFIILSIKK